MGALATVAMVTFSSTAFGEVGTSGGTGSGTAISQCKGTPANSGSNANNIAIGCNAVNNGDRGVALGYNTVIGSGSSQSVAIGSDTSVTGDQAVGIGNNVVTSGNSAIAIGGDDIDKVRTAYGSSYKTITGVNLPSGYPKTTASGGGAVVVGVMGTQRVISLLHWVWWLML